MNKYYSRKNISGVGLIEVLITTVVVAVGLLAIASLQGELIGGSGVNKTRAECQVLANEKIEQLRDTVDKASYDLINVALAEAEADEEITGTTELFTRNWSVSTLTSPERKEINVTVTWGETANTENQCVVQTIIAYDSLGNSTIMANGEGGSGGSPSLNAESSDEISKYVNIPSTTPGSPVEVDGQMYIAQDVVTLDNGDDVQKGVLANECSSYSGLTDLENSIETVKVRRIDYDGVAGNEAIQLFEIATGAADGYCIPRIRFNGGVMIPIKGTVYSQTTDSNGASASLLDVTLFTFNASETGAYCIFKPEEGADHADYICYVGGNCTGATGGTDANVLTCPATPVAAAKVGPGGWRGKVGLLGIAAGGNNGRNVCFAEEVVATPTTLDTARNYYARHNGINEGINQPYSCHNFLIINGQANNAAVHNECKEEAVKITGLTLASKTIARAIAADDGNIFNPTVNESNCSGELSTSHTLTVNLIASGGTPITGELTSDLAVNCTGSGINYSCTELDSAADNSATWSYAGTAGTNNSCTGSGSYIAGGVDRTIDLNVTCTATRVITVSAAGTGTGTIANLVYSGTGAACSSSTSICTVPAAWAGTLTATGICTNTGATMTGSTVVSSSDSAASIIFGACNIPAVTYAISSASGSQNWGVTAFNCNSGSCNNLLPGTYAVAATLNGGGTQTCGVSVVITTQSKTVTVSKTNNSTCSTTVSVTP
ncbi:MAG: hypothetical protein K9L22_09975 [Methylococcaceae bacterium]|nr:hypothetical protein [Methylococcaceae bacterium]